MLRTLVYSKSDLALQFCFALLSVELRIAVQFCLHEFCSIRGLGQHFVGSHLVR